MPLPALAAVRSTYRQQFKPRSLALYLEQPCTAAVTIDRSIRVLCLSQATLHRLIARQLSARIIKDERKLTVLRR